MFIFKSALIVRLYSVHISIGETAESLLKWRCSHLKTFTHF